MNQNFSYIMWKLEKSERLNGHYRVDYRMDYRMVFKIRIAAQIYKRNNILKSFYNNFIEKLKLLQIYLMMISDIILWLQ